MFVRVKKNRSGSSSVLVVRKASGRYIVVKNLGVATDEKAIESLRKKGEEWIKLHTDPLPMQFGFDEREEARRVLDNIDFVYHDGARIILNQVYHLIGFDEIKDSIRHYPVCIAKTQFSFSADSTRYGSPEGFTIRIRDVILNCGSEMIVAIAGDMLRMPGLPKNPQAQNIVIVNGEIEGLS